ncbi:RraA family protein, partial [Burkholderia pseudomallei]
EEHHAHVRDANAILDLNMPAYAHGTYAYALQGRHNFVDYSCSITVGHVRIRQGDLIFGDGEVVCVNPLESDRDVITSE